MTKHIVLLLAALSVCFIWTGSLSAAEQQKTLLHIPWGHMEKYPEYKSDLQWLKFLDPRVGAYRGPDRLDLFEKESEALLQKWLEKDMLLYYELTWKVCSILISTDLSDDKIREGKLHVKYAMSALKKGREMSKSAVEMPINTEIWLLSAIIPEPEYNEGKLRGEDWVRRRSEKMRWLDHTFQRIEKGIDENYDFSVSLSSRPNPPAGVGAWISGLGPSAIKDPKLRAEYEERLAEHKRKVEERSRQRQLRKLRERFNRLVRFSSISAYLKPPYNTKELEAYLQKYIKDQQVKESILERYMLHLGQKK